MAILLIVGTDTEVGKTVLTSALVAYWQRYRDPETLGLLKLIQTGSGDRELYQRLFFPETSLDAIAPLHFSAPLAPPLAAWREGRSLDLAPVWQALTQLNRERSFVLAEALGGLGSPMTPELTVADLAAAWRLPAVLVVDVKLGAIAQTVANVALARQTGVALVGIVRNCLTPAAEERLDDWLPGDLVESLTQIPIAGTLPFLDNPEDPDRLARAASRLEIERLLPVLI